MEGTHLAPARRGGAPMITFDRVPVYLAPGPTDMRKQINGLAAQVDGVLGMDPFGAALYVFCNRARNRLRLLLFDGDGFVMVTKRLERGRFPWPSGQAGGAAVLLDTDELATLLGATRLERRLRREEVSGLRAY